MQLNSDLHCHPSLKAANQGVPGKNIWDEFPASPAISRLNKEIQKVITPLARYSQSHLESCINGNTRLLFVSVYPFERPFLMAKPRRPFKLLFGIILPKKKYDLLGEAVLGIPEEEIRRRIEEARSDNGVNYYAEYLSELDHLLDPQNVSSNNPAYAGKSFHIAADYADYQNLISDQNKIVGIFTVEGAHSFGNYDFKDPFDKPLENLSQEIQRRFARNVLGNIAEIKNNQDVRRIPFFVSLCHHFNNLMAGHATSLSDHSPLIKVLRQFYRPGMRHLFNQDPAKNAGLNQLGEQVIRSLLSKDNGRRILIDTKHMSVQTRIDFYRLLANDFNGDIPIIHSHGAVNGVPTLEAAGRMSSTFALDKNRFFSSWNINLTDEDIQTTFQSKGIIGVCLHEGRMPGYRFKQDIKKLKKDNDAEGVRDMYLKLFWSNVFHIAKVQLDVIVEATDNRKNWNGISLGSDYDGVVDPFDNYAVVADYPNLRQDMANYLDGDGEVLEVASETPLSTAEVNRIKNGFSTDQILELLFFKNADQFLSEFFTNTYLSNPLT